VSRQSLAWASALATSSILAACNPLGAFGVGQDVTGLWTVIATGGTMDMSLIERDGKVSGAFQVGLLSGGSISGKREWNVIRAIVTTVGTYDMAAELSWDGQTMKGYFHNNAGAPFTATRKSK